MNKSTLEERFWAKVSKTAACWVWTGATGYGGYGSFHDTRIRKRVKAHRFAYGLFGPIPEGLTLDHLCRNRLCVRPAHLQPVTNRENVLRGDGPSAQNARKTHCVRDHEFTPENTYRSGGRRHCRECRRDECRRRRQ